MRKLIEIDDIWYAVAKDNTLRCNNRLAGKIDDWATVCQLPRPVYSLLLPEFEHSLDDIDINDSHNENDFSHNIAHVSEVSLENIQGSDKYVNYHCAITNNI